MIPPQLRPNSACNFQFLIAFGRALIGEPDVAPVYVVVAQNVKPEGTIWHNEQFYKLANDTTEAKSPKMPMTQNFILEALNSFAAEYSFQVELPSRQLQQPAHE